MELCLNLFHDRIGGLLRFDTRAWISSFSCSEGVEKDLLAELFAVQKAFLAWDLGYKKVICGTSCLEIVDMFNKGRHFELHICAHIVLDFAALINCSWFVSIHLVYREVNNCADFFAKLGA